MLLSPANNTFSKEGIINNPISDRFITNGKFGADNQIKTLKDLGTSVGCGGTCYFCLKIYVFFSRHIHIFIL